MYETIAVTKPPIDYSVVDVVQRGLDSESYHRLPQAIPEIGVVGVGWAAHRAEIRDFIPEFGYLLTDGRHVTSDQARSLGLLAL